MPPEQAIEDAIKAMHDAKEFMTTRAAAMVTREELDRVVADMQGKLERAQQPAPIAPAAPAAVQRRAIFGAGQRSNVVPDGPYAGMTHFDLSIVKALREAAEFGRGRAALAMETHEDGADGARGTISVRALPQALPQWAPESWGVLRRAMDSVTSGAGADILPREMDRNIWRDVWLHTPISGFLPRINMPTNPFDIPLQLGLVNFYKQAAEGETVDPTDITTQKNTLTAGAVKAVTAWSYELEEDAVIAMLPSVREAFARNLAFTIDDLLLQADSQVSNANINSDVALAANSRYLYGGGDGLIKQALVTGPAGNRKDINGAVASSTFRTLLSLMGKYGINPGGNNDMLSSDVAFITDIRTWLQMLGLTEVITMEKFGPHATIKSGQLGAVYGVPVIVSGQMGVAKTNGKIDVTTAANNTTGRILAVNRMGWYHGFRREILIETERDIEKTQLKMVVSFRMAATPRGTASTAIHTALAYDITGV